MKAVLQRVLSASVAIDSQIVGEIGRGYLLLVGIEKGDDEAQVAGLVDKVLGLRLFANERGKLDYDIRQVNGSVLVVSQFTLLADTQRGRRPSFTAAAAPDEAQRLYQELVQRFAEAVPVQSGRFAADMRVSLVNDGPFTLTL
ncbi:MAG: D-tyrosyl-tRNA(Tyr) deacylase [Gammaproteobacteria bacterium]|jgi:D-tyrosyl-tRNA(Tyr) deacylase|nr:D-tyrosyl-tRNA(Tyr) deacylase [Gammaproteobacteria bacterium]